MPTKGKTICYYRGCKRTVPGAPGPRYCREHAPLRIIELRDELKTLRDAYPEQAKSANGD